MEFFFFLRSTKTTTKHQKFGKNKLYTHSHTQKNHIIKFLTFVKIEKNYNFFYSGAWFFFSDDDDDEPDYQKFGLLCFWSMNWLMVGWCFFFCFFGCVFVWILICSPCHGNDGRRRQSTPTTTKYHYNTCTQKKNRHQQQRCYNPKMTSSSSGWNIYLNPMYIMAPLLLLLLQHTTILLLYTFTKIHIEFRIAAIWLWPYQHHYYYYYCYYPHT